MNMNKISSGFFSLTSFILFTALIFPAHASQQVATRVIGDAAVDLVHINVNNELVIEAGDGMGGFASPVTLSLNIDLESIEFGDFNSDGFNDLLALDTDGDLSLLINDTAGDFLAEISIPVGLQLLEIISDFNLTDMNGDGLLDIVVSVDGLVNARVLVIYGDGLGGFLPALEFDFDSVITSVLSLDLADINGDGVVDVVIKDLLGIAHLMLSDGLGGYNLPSVLAGVLPTGSIYFNDFNNDQIPDMVVLDELLGLVTIRLGNGDGTFLSGVGVTVGLTPTDLVVVDLNLDGNKDLAVVNIGDNSVNVLIGDGLGGVLDLVGQTLEDLLGLIPALGLPTSIVSSDFNSDCRLDIGIWNDITQSFIIQLNQTGPAPSDLIFCSVFDY